MTTKTEGEKMKEDLIKSDKEAILKPFVKMLHKKLFYENMGKWFEKTSLVRMES